ncbi:MAG TPA: hypothetical protein VGK71_01175 [Nitrospirota bacterium]
MRLIVAIVLTVFFASPVIAYQRDGITVTGRHANYTSMGASAVCEACHLSQWATKTAFARTTSFVRFGKYTTVVLKRWTSLVQGFAQAADNPGTKVCLACHNATAARLSIYTTTAYRRHAPAINAVEHSSRYYSPRRTAARFGSMSGMGVKPPKALFGHSLVKNWAKCIRQINPRYGKTINQCADCHLPHGGSKAKYLR